MRPPRLTPGGQESRPRGRCEGSLAGRRRQAGMVGNEIRYESTGVQFAELPRLLNFDPVAVDLSGKLLNEPAGLLDDKHFDAWLPGTKTLSRSHHARYRHQPPVFSSRTCSIGFSAIGTPPPLPIASPGPQARAPLDGHRRGKRLALKPFWKPLSIYHHP